MSPVKVSEVRHGRNFIRSGDLIRVKPSRTGKHDGFVARFLNAEDGIYALQQLDTGGRPMAFRFVRAERVRRLATTRSPWR